ncbi:trypsin-like peptidase domain-containing protein [Actinokineospora sp. G85]|uniref:trypsin-like peptidase domain-containing protein n=1 Tax=Actinokineospora sp. G85 TaxID=3406626 RepID=UPI003C76F53C
MLGLSGRVEGAGMLLGGSTVLTCAHVVEAALAAVPAGHPPEVLVRFVGCDGMPESRARVRGDGWAPALADGRRDIALLELGTAFPEIPGAPLVRLGFVRDRLVHTYGFPHPHQYGVWVNDAELAGPVGAGGEWVQLNSKLPGERVRRGFSGAGVIDKETNAVLGMVVTEYTDDRMGLAYLIPVEVIVRYLPAVAGWVGAPPRALPDLVVADDERAGWDGWTGVFVDAAGKTPAQVAEHISGQSGGRAVLGPADGAPLAVTRIDSSSAPEDVLIETVWPLLRGGTPVVVQFSGPDSSAARLARRWQEEGNAARLARLAMLVEIVEAEENRTRALVLRFRTPGHPPVAVPGHAAELRMRLGALRAVRGAGAGRMRRALVSTERRAERAHRELVDLHADLDARAARLDELRGLLRAYNARVTDSGLVEDERLGVPYRAAMAALSAGLGGDLATADELVRDYVDAVRRRAGAR